MGRDSSVPFQLDWFNVTYRSIYSIIGMLVLLAGAGAGYWYYHFIHAPRNNALAAIERAEKRFDEAAALEGDDQIDEIVSGASVALREGRDSFRSMRFDEARVAAINSENLSLKALRLAGEQDASTRLVRFYRIEGDVRVKRSGEFSWEQARKKMVLGVGDQVKTSSSGSTQLIYFDGPSRRSSPGRCSRSATFTRIP